MKNNNAIVTVATNTYFHHAVVLGNSIKQFEQAADFILFIVGYDPHDPRYHSCDFHILDAQILNPEEWERFVFQYDPIAACCALKSRALSYLLEHYQKVIYLDNDIKLFSPLNEGWNILENNDLSLTPHHEMPPNDRYWKFYCYSQLSNDIFNAGYVGVSRSGKDFLEWWWKKNQHNCLMEPMIGIFLDQAYLQYAVIFVQKLNILRNIGYNVARWNLNERKLEKRDSHYVVNGLPLIFFHFSTPQYLELHAQLFEQETDIVLKLYEDYEKELSLEKEKWTPEPYPYKSFQDGTLISPDWREWVRRDIPELRTKNNPFELTASERKEIEIIMAKRPENFWPNKDREINDWKNSFLSTTPTLKKLRAYIDDLEWKIKYKLIPLETSLPHQWLSKAILFVKNFLKNT